MPYASSHCRWRGALPGIEAARELALRVHHLATREDGAHEAQ